MAGKDNVLADALSHSRAAPTVNEVCFAEEVELMVRQARETFASKEKMVKLAKLQKADEVLLQVIDLLRPRDLHIFTTRISSFVHSSNLGR